MREEKETRGGGGGGHLALQISELFEVLMQFMLPIPLREGYDDGFA